MAKEIFWKNYNPIMKRSAELQAQILKMLKRGKSQNAIARELGKSLGTVGYHVSRLRLQGKYKG
jgi:DNA-binding NarL/FixJ family response regulator